MTDRETEKPGTGDEEYRFRPGNLAALEGRPMTTWAMARRLPQLVRRGLLLGWRVDRRAVSLLLGCQALSAVLEAAGLLATTSTITALIASGDTAGRLNDALPSVVLLAAAAGARALLGIAIVNVSNRLSPRISREAELDMLTAAVNAELVAYDHPGFNDAWENADRGADVARDLITESQQLMSCLASLTAAAGVVTVLHPVLLPLLVLAVLPQGAAGMKAARIHYEAGRSMAAERRTLGHLRWYIADKETADQVRSGTMADFLLARYRSIGARVDATTDEAVHRGARYALLGAAAAGLAGAVMWAALLGLLVTGHMSLAAGGTAVFALRSVGSSLRGMVGYGTQLFRTGLYFDDWVEFTEQAGGHRISRGTVIAGDPAAVAVKDVSFTYPDADAPALQEVTLHVRRGEILALVGENGSGKTTLSKLLSGLYVPDLGTVSWDGVSMRDLDAQSVWARTAVVPQKFAHWPLTARDNITLGQRADGGDDAVMRAAEQSGALEVIDDLRSGLDTLLARQYFGGQELSGGQWQRIAIARAFHRSGLLILDEPTSALDPRAEHRIFTGLREAAADRPVVLITHRLANVAVADKIVVLDQGRIVQHGTFAELNDQPGLFRELMELQSDRPGALPAPRPPSGRTAAAGTSPQAEGGLRSGTTSPERSS